MIWLFLAAAFLIQDNILVTLALVQAEKQRIPLIVIHGYFIISTIIDILLPYYLVARFWPRIENNKIGQWLSESAEQSKKTITRFGVNKGLVFLGIFNYVFLDGALIGWWQIDIKKPFVIFFLSNIVWYAGVILLAKSVQTITPSNDWAISIVISLSILLWPIIKKLFKTNFRV